jgi:hypothetical protein
MMAINCFVVGKLGEIVKKVFELEDALRQFPKNSIFIAELASYSQLLEIWPIQEPMQVHLAMHNFKAALAKLQQVEKMLRDATEHKDQSYIGIALPQYLKSLDACRESLTLLNDLGKHIGTSPWMQIDDFKVEQTQDSNS